MSINEAQIIFIVVFIFIVCVGLAAVFSVFNQAASHIRSDLDEIRSRYGGKFIRQKRGGSVQFNNNGTTFLVSTRRQGTRAILKIKTQWPIAVFRMKVFPDTLDPKLKNFLGMQDIEIGAPEFDKAYVIQSNEPEEVARILSPVQHQLMDLGRFDLTVTTGRCQFEKEIDQFRTPRQIVDVFVKAYFSMRDGILETEQIQMVVTEQEDSICMVCGEEVTKDPVTCRSCKTPHHRDCWEYLGMCSTYGCGQKRYRIDSADRIVIRPKRK